MDDSETADVRRSAVELYAEGQQIWDRKDLWNLHKRSEIDAFVSRKCLPLINVMGRVLNAGSGGEGYEWLTGNTVNSDLFFEQVKKLPLAVVSDICKLPFEAETFDISICVGSVLNYVSLLEAIGELSRTLKIGGHLIMHYESSGSFEQLWSPNRNKSVVRIETVNSGRIDKIWIYSPAYVSKALKSFGLRTTLSGSFHIASALGTRLGFSQDSAAAFTKLDRWLGAFSASADDQIILAEKIA